MSHRLALRIAMVGYTHYAGDARPRREAEAFAVRGDDVLFVALDEPGAPRHEIIGGVHVRRVPMPRYRGRGTARYLASYASFLARAGALITREHVRRPFDIVHVHTMPDAMVLAAATAKGLGAKVILDVHDTMPELYQSKLGLNAAHPLVRMLRWQERRACSFADAVIAVHEPHRARLVANGVPPERIEVLPNLPDPALFGPRRDPRQSVSRALVYHGTVARRLGVDLIVEAMPQVLRAIPDATLTILGEGDDDAYVRARISALSLQRAVRFPGRHVPVEQVPAMLRDAAVGVVANRRDPATELMLPVKLLEYAHLGIPAVAPFLPTMAHYFGGDEVAWFTPSDVPALASALVSLLSDPARAEAQAHRAGLVLDRLAWDNLRWRLFAVADRLMGARGTDGSTTPQRSNEA